MSSISVALFAVFCGVRAHVSMCNQSPLPSVPSTPINLTCWVGGLADGLAPSAVGLDGAASVACAAVSLPTADSNSTRIHIGLSATDLIGMRDNGVIIAGAHNASVCYSSFCNGPTSFPSNCTGSEIHAPLRSFLCSPGKSVPSPAPPGLPCYATGRGVNNISVVTLNSTEYCLTASLLCDRDGTLSESSPCFGLPVNSTTRVWMPSTSALATSLNRYVSPRFFMEAMLSNVSICASPYCNSPFFDYPPCGPASVTVGNVSIASLPSSAFDGIGRLTVPAFATITATVRTSVQSAGCPLCTVTITRIFDRDSGLLLDGGRALQAGIVVVVIFSISGSTAAVRVVKNSGNSIASTLGGSLRVIYPDAVVINGVSLPSSSPRPTALPGGGVTVIEEALTITTMIGPLPVWAIALISFFSFLSFMALCCLLLPLKPLQKKKKKVQLPPPPPPPPRREAAPALTVRDVENDQIYANLMFEAIPIPSTDKNLAASNGDFAESWRRWAK